MKKLLGVLFKGKYAIKGVTVLLFINKFTCTFLCFMFQDQYSLHLYSINGKLLSSDSLSSGLGHMAVTDAHLITGSTSGQLVVRELFG